MSVSPASKWKKIHDYKWFSFYICGRWVIPRFRFPIEAAVHPGRDVITGQGHVTIRFHCPVHVPEAEPRAGEPLRIEFCMVEKRRFARVLFERTVRFTLNGVVYRDMKIRNLSIGGLFVPGDFPGVAAGDRCQLELHETGRHSCLILRFGARVVRTERDGIGLRFTEMTEDAYRFLQTMVLYYTDDPYGVAREFLEDFPDGSAAGM